MSKKIPILELSRLVALMRKEVLQGVIDQYDKNGLYSEETAALIDIKNIGLLRSWLKIRQIELVDSPAGIPAQQKDTK